jgi:hypothetical protein
MLMKEQNGSLHHSLLQCAIASIGHATSLIGNLGMTSQEYCAPNTNRD